jgi:exodeoxyribonuclease VII large subunit
MNASINAPTHNLPEYSVSEIAGAIKQQIEDRFGYVRVRGEISGWKLATSGHGYFRLKDDAAVLDAVIWKGTLSKLPLKPEDGLEVIISGRLTTYPNKSSYQIIADKIEPAGAGALMALLEARKQKLAAEGLFDERRKKPLPFMPEVIGVITSPTGAVIRDILHRISERFPCHVLVWPVLVQGDQAAEQIANAINGFNSLKPESCIPRADLLIVARGGGSIEDLWAFNEEVVVRAAANSAIPLISAVGHETDTTLIDFAADRRAPTPTAAAEMAVPVRSELVLSVSEYGSRSHRAMLRTLEERAQKLVGLVRGLPKPEQLLEIAIQKLDSISERLGISLPNILTRRKETLVQITARLNPNLLLRDAKQQQTQLTDFTARLNRAMALMLQKQNDTLSHHARMLKTVSFENTLKRGFAMVKTLDGKLVSSAVDAQRAEHITIQFADGVTAAHIQKEGS